VTDYDRWLEEPYQSDEEPSSGDVQVIQFGLEIEVTVEDDELHSFAILGIEDRDEALECAEDAAASLGRTFDPARATDAEIMQLISDAFLPGRIHMPTVLEQLRAMDDDQSREAWE
jgi:hypothetical protein